MGMDEPIMMTAGDWGRLVLLVTVVIMVIWMGIRQRHDNWGGGASGNSDKNDCDNDNGGDCSD